MSNLERKIKRKIAKKEKKDREELEKKMQNKLNMFDMLPDNCLTCNKKFDKKNKEHAMTWTVVVKEEQGKVNLFCPECIAKVRGVIENG